MVKGVAERNHYRLVPPTIFCIDEIHQLMISFKASSYGGIADLLKPYLTTGDLYMIGATTREEYEDYVTVEPAIDRRFQKINLRQPDVPQTISILMNLKGNFEKHYNVEITLEAITRLCKLVDRFIRNRNNPDKSLLAMDHACARMVKANRTGVLDAQSIEEAVASEAGVDAGAVK
jgi:ATP-dependent Clp protease ATP-binding subunit ClpA